MRSEGFEKLTYRRRKQLDSLYSQALLALLARVVCGVVLAAIMFDSSRTRNLLSWGGIMITVCRAALCSDPRVPRSGYHR